MYAYLKRNRFFRKGHVDKTVSKYLGRFSIPKRNRGYLRTSGFYGRYGVSKYGSHKHYHTKELKFRNIDINQAPVSSVGNITESINKIAQGTNEVQRIGRVCKMKSIHWRLRCFLPNTISATATTDTMRIILYLDKQANGLTATVTDILESANFQSFRNLANSRRFKILCDKQVTLNVPSSDSTEYGRVSRNFQIHKKVNSQIEFNSTTGAMTEIRSNNYGVLLISEFGEMQLESRLRIRFEG